mgnify:FL=1
MMKNNWKKTLLDENSSVRAAVQCLNKSALQIILVVNKKKKLIGTITDGNIRRAMLSGLNINSSIKKIINRKPYTVSKSLSKSAINKLMNMRQIHQIPIIDKRKNILGLYAWDQFGLLETKKKV